MKNTIQKMTTDEYYIGLKKDSKSVEWRWISDDSKVNATRGKFPWAKDEPSGDGNCAVMYKDYRLDYGLFNDGACTEKRPFGYICESPVDSNDQEGMPYKFLYIYMLLHKAILLLLLLLLLFFKQTTSKCEIIFHSYALEWLMDPEGEQCTGLTMTQ